MSNVQRPLSAAFTPESCRMLRSPSHDSFSTDLSPDKTVSSVSGLNDPNHLNVEQRANSKNRLNKSSRDSSPNPDISLHFNSRSAVISEKMWLEECNDLIRSCGQLSSVLGIQKSFSTSDVTQLPNDKPFDSNGMRHIGYIPSNAQPRQALSELILNSFQRCNYMLESARLDHTSRSCSTWVAIGELASTSQLPSPHGHCSLSVTESSSQQQLTAPNVTTNSTIETSQPSFTANDFIRSFNKKIRENYIRSRLLTTYRAIERLSQSEFNLDQLASVAVTFVPPSSSGQMVEGPGPTELVVPTFSTPTPDSTIEAQNDDKADSIKRQRVLLQLKAKVNLNPNLTIHDIEEDRGKPLSRYDRNMMIFNWLHSLDETAPSEE